MLDLRLGLNGNYKWYLKSVNSNSWGQLHFPRSTKHFVLNGDAIDSRHNDAMNANVIDMSDTRTKYIIHVNLPGRHILITPLMV